MITLWSSRPNLPRSYNHKINNCIYYEMKKYRNITLFCLYINYIHILSYKNSHVYFTDKKTNLYIISTIKYTRFSKKTRAKNTPFVQEIGYRICILKFKKKYLINHGKTFCWMSVKVLCWIIANYTITKN